MVTIVRCRTRLVWAAVVLGLGACNAPADETGSGFSPAKGGLDATGDPVVNEVQPPAATQDTTLDVRVLGANYDRGSAVELLVDGLPAPKVHTNSTRYRNSGELIANITIDADAVVTLYDVLVTTSRGKKGIGIEKFEVQSKPWTPSLLEGSVTLPDSTGVDGLYGDGQGSYPTTITIDGVTELELHCPRRAALRLPPAWAGVVAQGTTSHCSSRLDLNILAACPDGTSCPLGTSGHDPAGHYGPDINYYFHVTAPKPKGKGTIQIEYDVVWIDVTYRVTRWAGGVPNGTACEWRVTGSTAELWTGSPVEESRAAANAPMALDVQVRQIGGGC